MTLARAAAAEAIGTALLLAIVVGSGIMGERLADGNAAIALLANSIATGAGLYVLIIIFGPISEAHFNPLVSAVSLRQGTLTPRACGTYVLAQVVGAFAGVASAHAMFELPLMQVSAHIRPTTGEAFGEVIATFGLVLAIMLTSRFRRDAIALVVAGFITSAYWFTSSTSFANPAVTMARAATDTFAGISPHDVPLFIAGQIVGGALAFLFARWLLRDHDYADGAREPSDYS
ncbi:MAG: MIP/aquaporin family protein [Betaproteobacteria bacterium]